MPTTQTQTNPGINRQQLDELNRLHEQVDALDKRSKDAALKPIERDAASQDLIKAQDSYRNMLSDLSKSSATGAVYIDGPNGSVYEVNPGQEPKRIIDPSAPLSAAKVANPDEDQLTAIKRETEEQARAQRQRNEAAGKFYITDADRIAVEQRGRQLGMDEDKINAEIARAGEASKRADEELKLKGNESVANVGLTNATAGKVGAETDLTRAQIKALDIKTDSDVDRARAAGNLDQAQADKIKEELKRPAASTSDTTTPYLTTYNPATGKYDFQQNQAYLPKDTGSQVAQLQQQAQAKADELHGLVTSGKLDGATASAQFNQWWDSTVEPRRSAIDQAQQQTKFENQQKAIDTQRAAMGTAQQAGTQAIDAWRATSGQRVGPGFAAATQQILDAFKNKKAVGNIDASGLFYDMPDVNDMAQQATTKALAQISPLAALQNGQPGGGGLQVPQGMDLSTALDRTRYQFGGGPPAPAPPTAVAPGAPAPVPVTAGAGTTGLDWDELQKRLAADRALQARQGQVSF